MKGEQSTQGIRISHPAAERAGLMVYPAPGHSTSGLDDSRGAQVTLRVSLKESTLPGYRSFLQLLKQEYRYSFWIPYHGFVIIDSLSQYSLLQILKR